MIWTQAIRRGLARAAIPRLFDAGYSANAGLAFFKIKGPGLARKLWLSDWREITGAKKLERAYRFIPEKIRLSYNLMAGTETYQRKKFKYVFDTEAEDIKTGERVTRSQSMESNIRLSIEEAEAKWLDKIMDEEKPYSWEGTLIPLSTQLRVVYRKLPIAAAQEQPSWIETEPLGPEWV